jgi:hypothetical protein
MAHSGAARAREEAVFPFIDERADDGGSCLRHKGSVAWWGTGRRGTRGRGTPAARQGSDIASAYGRRVAWATPLAAVRARGAHTRLTPAPGTHSAHAEPGYGGDTVANDVALGDGVVRAHAGAKTICFSPI